MAKKPESGELVYRECDQVNPGHPSHVFCRNLPRRAHPPRSYHHPAIRTCAVQAPPKGIVPQRWDTSDILTKAATHDLGEVWTDQMPVVAVYDINGVRLELPRFNLLV